MRRTGIALALVAGFALACSSEAPPEQVQAPKKPKRPAQLANLEPEAVIPVEYRYDPEGKADPFKSFVQVDSLDPDSLSTPLERFDLSQLEVSAIIWGSDRPRALIQDPSGKGYIVSAGTAIGKNKGRVISIEDNLVLVKETYVDFRDRATTKEVEMRLYDRQGG